MIRSVSIMVVGLIAICLSAASASRLRAEEASASPSLSGEDIQRLIEELENTDFAERQDAMRRLIEAGEAAIEPLTRAAQSVERETMVRSLEILDQFSKSTDQSIKSAALAALEQVTKSSNVRAANRARAILDPPKPKEVPAPRVGGGLIIGPNGIQGGRIVIGGGNNGIQIGGGGVQLGKGGQIITTKVDGDNRSLQVLHGDGREIVIENTANSVSIRVTQLDKQAAPKTAKAKNADELKEKDAELYDVYKQYDGYRKSGVTIKGG